MSEVTEIDAPPRAYFDIPTGDGFDSPPIRLEFKTLCIVSKDKAKLEKQGEMELNIVRSELEGRGGGIIWWRTRPTIEQYGESKWQWRCRLDTSPQFSDWWWAPISKTEGAEPKEI